MPGSTGFGSFAAGNISPRRFCKASSSSGKYVQAGAGEKCAGISQPGTRNVNYSTLNDGYCAISGEGFRLFRVGEVCHVEAGGAITLDDRLKSDASGKAVTASSGDEIGAIALEAATAAGQFILVRVTDPTVF